jgi:hypothetical protein
VSLATGSPGAPSAPSPPRRALRALSPAAPSLRRNTRRWGQIRSDGMGPLARRLDVTSNRRGVSISLGLFPAIWRSSSRQCRLGRLSDLFRSPPPTVRERGSPRGGLFHRPAAIETHKCQHLSCGTTSEAVHTLTRGETKVKSPPFTPQGGARVLTGPSTTPIGY